MLATSHDHMDLDPSVNAKEPRPRALQASWDAAVSCGFEARVREAPQQLPFDGALCFESISEVDFCGWSTSAQAWLRLSGSTSSDDTGPDEAAEGDWYIYTEASSGNDNKAGPLHKTRDHAR